MAEDMMKEQISRMLRGIERYNPENLKLLEQYVEYQIRENYYNLEANLALLKLYQFNPTLFKTEVVVNILLKALTNMPHTDFVLCKCLIDLTLYQDYDHQNITTLFELHSLLETCQMESFWKKLQEHQNLWEGVAGFQDSVRKYAKDIVGITYQSVPAQHLAEVLGVDKIDAALLQQNNWKDTQDGSIFIKDQEENIKTKNITEKIDFENVASVIAAYR